MAADERTPPRAPYSATLLVVAKSPVSGRAKTRLAGATDDASQVGADLAADLAAAALLDTLAAARRTPAAAHVVALTGELADAARADEVRAALAAWTVLPQRGDTFAERLAHAHQDAATPRGTGPVLQIGMDTPQVTAELLTDCLRQLDSPDVDAVLGPATDGGWWVLGVRDATLAAALADVPTSRGDTAERTARALRTHGARVAHAPELCDVDTLDDARAVVATHHAGRFAAAMRTHRLGAPVPAAARPDADPGPAADLDVDAPPGPAA